MPFIAWSSSARTEARNSSLMAGASTSRWPFISAAVYPVTSAALLFHSLMCPSTSTPRMGALADSMSILRSLATRPSSALPALSSVMSCPTPTTPTISLFASRRVAALSRISTRCEAFV